MYSILQRRVFKTCVDPLSGNSHFPETLQAERPAFWPLPSTKPTPEQCKSPSWPDWSPETSLEKTPANHSLQQPNMQSKPSHVPPLVKKKREIFQCSQPQCLQLLGTFALAFIWFLWLLTALSPRLWLATCYHATGLPCLGLPAQFIPPQGTVPGLSAGLDRGPQAPSNPPCLEDLDNNSFILGFTLPSQYLSTSCQMASSLSFSPRLSRVQALYLFKEAPAIICASVLSNHTIS